MFVRDVYSKAEEEALKKWRERSESLVGWIDDMPSDHLSSFQDSEFDREITGPSRTARA